MRKHQRVCDSCKQDGFFKTKHWVWLESAALKYGVSCWPEETSGLVTLLKLRQQQMLCQGLSRRAGVLWSRYQYELGHRYPASLGGKLVAENLVIIPMIINRKMGERHGKGLELFKVDNPVRVSRKEIRRVFISRYSMSELEDFAKLKDTGSDFSMDGVGAAETLKIECNRLGIEFNATSDKENEVEIMKVVDKYIEVCGASSDLLKIINEADYESMDKSYWVRNLTPDDIQNLSETDFKVAKKWMFKLRDNKAVERETYHSIVMDSRNVPAQGGHMIEKLNAHHRQLQVQGVDMPF